MTRADRPYPAEFRATLKALDISQKAFAERLGVSANTVNRWAKGTLPVPRYAEMVLELMQKLDELCIWRAL